MDKQEVLEHMTRARAELLATVPRAPTRPSPALWNRIVVWLAEQETRWRCPTCGQPVDIYSETCRACGAELPR